MHLAQREQIYNYIAKTIITSKIIFHCTIYCDHVVKCFIINHVLRGLASMYNYELISKEKNS